MVRGDSIDGVCFQLHGVIGHYLTKEPIKGVSVQIKDRVSGDLIIDRPTSALGDYGYQLQEHKLGDILQYEISFKKEGFLSRTYAFDLPLDRYGMYEIQDLLEEMPKMVKLEKGMDLGKILNLNPIYFDLNKSNIREDAGIELSKVVKVLEENPTISIELGAHTDSRGSDAYNMKLSGRRAKSSRDYIVKNGIKGKRVSSKGYGETLLVNECANGVACDEEAHQLNRRTEFVVTDF